MDTSIIVLLVFLALVALAVIMIYNGIITRKNAVQRAWAGVVTQERQKNKILPELEKIVSEHKEFETQVLSDITKLRSGLTQLNDGDINPQGLGDIEKLMKSVSSGIQVTMEAYPDLKTVTPMTNLMKEIAEQQENIGAALRIFNQNVEAFNSGIEVFPNNLVNSMLNKEQLIAVFYDDEASAGFDYKPNF